MEDSFQIIAYMGGVLPEQYKPMIFSKWLRSLRYGNDYFKLIDSKSYFDIYHKHIERLLCSKGCEVRLAVLADDHDIVLGWSVSRGVILDYVHVHKDYRRTGIGTMLLTDIRVITHITRQGASFWHNRLPEAFFNPFL